MAQCSVALGLMLPVRVDYGTMLCIDRSIKRKLDSKAAHRPYFLRPDVSRSVPSSAIRQYLEFDIAEFSAAFLVAASADGFLGAAWEPASSRLSHSSCVGNCRWSSLIHQHRSRIHGSKQEPLGKLLCKAWWHWTVKCNHIRLIIYNLKLYIGKCTGKF
jgi:hypothetical protein